VYCNWTFLENDMLSSFVSGPLGGTFRTGCGSMNNTCFCHPRCRGAPAACL